MSNYCNNKLCPLWITFQRIEDLEKEINTMDISKYLKSANKRRKICYWIDSIKLWMSELAKISNKNLMLVDLNDLNKIVRIEWLLLRVRISNREN